MHIKIKKALISIIVGIMVVIIAILMNVAFQLTLVQTLVTCWILTTLYALFAFFLIDPVTKITPIQYVDRPVLQRVVQIVEKPTLKEVQIPMENRVIEVVEKPVIQEVVKYVDRPVYKFIEKKAKKLNIKKFNYIGSTQTKTYHKRTCKFSKMLKQKYKLHNNSEMFFKKKHYKACKTCLKNKKK